MLKCTGWDHYVYSLSTEFPSAQKATVDIWTTSNEVVAVSVTEYSKEVNSQKGGVHSSGVRGNSVQMLVVKEKKWKHPFLNSSQNIL